MNTSPNCQTTASQNCLTTTSQNCQTSTPQNCQNPSKPKPSATGKSGVKRKIDLREIDFKYNAIMEVEKGAKSKAQFARELNIASTTLSTWIKNADTIKDGFKTFSPARKNMRTGQCDELETALLQWFKYARDQNAPISGTVLMAMAEQFAESLNIAGFKASTRWLDRFKERKGIVFRTVNGEARIVDVGSDAMTDLQRRRTELLKRYHPADVYNADETGLLFRMLPDKTLTMKGSDCSGGKRSKERITVLVCANMDGSDKLPLLVIGKFQNPRCFKNVKTLPTKYDSNTKAWMTGKLFKNG